jgi:hypothetical protein
MRLADAGYARGGTTGQDATTLEHPDQGMTKGERSGKEFKRWRESGSTWLPLDALMASSCELLRCLRRRTDIDHPWLTLTIRRLDPESR